MAAGRYDRLVVEQGSTFDLPITVPYDLTNGLARASARLAYNQEALVEFEVEILTTAATGSRINLHAPADAITAVDLGAPPDNFVPGVWDLEVVLAPTASNEVIRVLEGRCKFKPEATR